MFIPGMHLRLVLRGLTTHLQEIKATRLMDHALQKGRKVFHPGKGVLFGEICISHKATTFYAHRNSSARSTIAELG